MMQSSLIVADYNYPLVLIRGRCHM